MGITVHVTVCLYIYLFITTTRNSKLLTSKRKSHDCWFQDCISLVISRSAECSQCLWRDNRKSSHLAFASLTIISTLRYLQVPVIKRTQMLGTEMLPSLRFVAKCRPEGNHKRQKTEEDKAHSSGFIMDLQVPSILPFPKRKSQFSHLRTVAFSSFLQRGRRGFCWSLCPKLMDNCSLPSIHFIHWPVMTAYEVWHESQTTTTLCHVHSTWSVHCMKYTVIKQYK